MAGKIQIESVDITDPVCSHFENEIQTLVPRAADSKLEARCISFCESCRKVLGVDHRKGFWTG